NDDDIAEKTTAARLVDLERDGDLAVRFAPPASDESVAILVPRATPEEVKIIVYNLDQAPVNAMLRGGWDVEPGKWEVTEGIDTNDDDIAEKTTAARLVDLERGGELAVRFAPRASTVLTLKLKSRGTAYEARPDLGIGADDVKVDGRIVRVKVHSLGSVDAPAATVSLRASDGRVLASAPLPPLRAPVDLQPKTVEVTLPVPAGARLQGAEIHIEPEGRVREITIRNNVVRL
ncbi:MAG: hypothetical protein GY953_42840, partial [bacterium]|nr:hypothetical protein [bacterium]